MTWKFDFDVRSTFFHRNDLLSCLEASAMVSYKPSAAGCKYGIAFQFGFIDHHNDTFQDIISIECDGVDLKILYMPSIIWSEWVNIGMKQPTFYLSSGASQIE